MKHILALIFVAAALAINAAEPIVATITVTIPVTQEQLDAANAYVSTWNNGTGTSTLAERIRDDVISPWLKTQTEAAYTASVARLGEAAKGLTYAERIALIQQVQQQIEANK